MNKGPELYRKAKTYIPGGTQLLSKRPEMFLPDHWPAYYRAAHGIEVIDLDGRVYRDMSLMGIGACALGYADPDVDRAVVEALKSGSMCTLNAPEEVELAEVLCALHPWAQMVRYARAGGEAMAVAVRIARAATGRDRVAFCGYHGWNDWYLAANLGETDALDGHLLRGLAPAGVPRSLRGTALPFRYNRVEELKAIAARHRADLAAIIMEPQRDEDPLPAFLPEVRQIASDLGAVLIFDEITTGFRMTLGGIHLRLGIEPDMAVFAKAMANGYAMAAVIGREKIMQAAQSTFISSTNWTERLGPAAALATIRKHERENVAQHLVRIGARVLEGWREAARRTGLELEAGGLPSLIHFELAHPEANTLTTLFTQLMLERGYLAFHQFKPSLAHSDAHVDAYLRDVAECFTVLAEAIHERDAQRRLIGAAASRGFQRLTGGTLESLPCDRPPTVGERKHLGVE
jgi:glutamate-1-semialdehyde 2,1-aminomutase